MAKEMRMVTATHRQCCEIPGCSNRTYTYFTRRDNPSGAIWLCADCIKAMHGIVAPPVPEEPVGQEPEVAAEAETNEAEPVPEEPAKPRKSRGKKE